FQAEDGIRDGHVTGVQTCALPIYADVWMAYTLLQAGKAWNEPHYTSLGTALAKRIAAEEVVQIPGFGTALLPGAKGFHKGDSYRSEERRVGKECSSSWWTCQHKKP